MSSYKIGVNLRVTENSNQGGRKYMEDTHAIRFVKNDEGGFEFAYFGIFDGHGGGEASKFARDHLLDEITKYECFWNDNDEDVLHAIKSGFLDVHFAMWREVDKWPRTSSGFRSTSGTTASIAIIKNSKLYIGHVGDSGIALGFDDSGSEKFIRPKGTMLTVDHKPDSPEEKKRIEECGGQVVAKSGVQRVVWNRPRFQHQGPIRRSTPIDKIPFLAVARSLGDLWSYNYLNEQFVVSPEPDVSVRTLDPTRDKCLVLGSDGLWNMITAEESVSVVVDLEYHFEYKVINDPSAPVSYWINPAEKLVQRALNKWKSRLMRADNTSCVVVLIDPLGPRKLSLLKKEREENMRKLREVKEKQIQAAKITTRTSPRKSMEAESVKTDLKKSPAAKASPPSPKKVGDSCHKNVISPFAADKTRRHSIPHSMEFDLDDSIQAANVNKKLHFSACTLREKMTRAVDISDQILTKGSASALKKAAEALLPIHRGISSKKTDDQQCPESASALKKASKTHSKLTDLPFSNSSIATNSHCTRTRQRHCSEAVLSMSNQSSNPLTLLRNIKGKFLSENKPEPHNRNILTENSKQTNKANHAQEQPKTNKKEVLQSKDDLGICDSAAFKVRTKQEINEHLGHGHQLRNNCNNNSTSSKKLNSKPEAAALRRLSTDLDSSKRSSMRLRKSAHRSIRCKSQTENKNFVSKFRLRGLKRKRTCSDGAPLTKKVCRS